MNKRVVLHILSKILFLESVLLLLPTAVSLYYHELNNVKAFMITALISALLSIPFMIFKPKSIKINSREGIAIAALSWIVFPLIGAIPFCISGEIPAFCDAFFESVSGFTTTGSSILTDVESMSHGMIFWRSFTHWVGGMGVLVLTIAILPSGKDSSSLNLMRGECPGPEVGKLVPKGKSSALILYVIYTVLTVLLIVLLVIGKMPLFDSVCHAMGTAGTGGFGIKNTSVAFYNSAYIDYVISIFMILFGVNFNLYYFILAKRFSAVLKNSELKAYIGILLTSMTAIAVNIYSMYGSIGKSIRYSVFQVSSVITSTGYSTTDFDQWPEFSKMILLILMFIGACAGSTGGGFKISRVVIMYKSAKKSLKKMLHPKSVNLVKSDDKALDIETVHGVHSYLIIYLGLIVGSLLLISLNNFDFTTTFSSVVTCINNIGPGFNKVGPSCNFSGFSDLSKYVLSLDMLLGRLECIPILLILSPSLWKKKFY